MNRVNRFLMMIIAMMAIMMVAAFIDRGHQIREEQRWEEERAVVFEQARAEIEAKQNTIQNLSQNPQALAAFIEENELNYVEAYDAWSDEGDTEEEAYNETGMVTEEQIWEMEQEYGVSDNRISETEGSVSDNEVADNSVSDNELTDDSVSDNSISGNTISENSVSGNSISGNSISGNSISGNGIQTKEICASYQETIQQNKQDKEIIAGNTIDFSGIKIACLGDSITEGTNLLQEEGYEEMTYPYQLGQLLGAEEVVNLGIGGSAIGRYWSDPFVDRYREIPEDTDLIIVMGGTNDGFCVSEQELGSLEEKKEATFAGDLDELLKGLKEDYPDAVVVLITPLSNVLHDMLRKERDYLLPQSDFVSVMKSLAAEYEIPVIDLYHDNLLDTHDAAVIYNFMPDGVHGNSAGYQILAQHIAAKVIGLYEEMEQQNVSEEVE